MSGSGADFGQSQPPGPCPVRFELAGWARDQSVDGPAGDWRWRDPAGDTLVVTIVREPPYVHPESASLTAIRAACRDRASRAAAAIVGVERTVVDSIPGLLVLTKAHDGMGSSYRGQLLLPMSGPRYEVTVDAREHGMTGGREALVTALLAECGELRFEPPPGPGQPGRIHGWLQDPYDPAFDAGALNSVADDERIDVLMPGHPLAKVRGVLRAIAADAVVDRGHDIEWPARGAASWAATPEPRRGRLSPAAIAVLQTHLATAHDAGPVTSTAESDRPGSLVSTKLPTIGAAVAASACVGLAFVAQPDAAVIAAAIALILVGIRLRQAEDGSWPKRVGTALSLIAALGLLRHLMRLLNADE
jgi:hypothetical protein